MTAAGAPAPAVTVPKVSPKAYKFKKVYLNYYCFEIIKTLRTYGITCHNKGITPGLADPISQWSGGCIRNEKQN